MFHTNILWWFPFYTNVQWQYHFHIRDHQFHTMEHCFHTVGHHLLSQHLQRHWHILRPRQLPLKESDILPLLSILITPQLLSTDNTCFVNLGKPVWQSKPKRPRRTPRAPASPPALPNIRLHKNSHHSNNNLHNLRNQLSYHFTYPHIYQNKCKAQFKDLNKPKCQLGCPCTSQCLHLRMLYSS